MREVEIGVQLWRKT